MVSSCSPGNCYTVFFSSLHTIFGIILSSFGIFVLTMEPTVAGALIMLLGLYSTLVGIVGIVSYAQRKGVKTVHLVGLIVNSLCILAGLIVSIVALDDILNDFKDSERGADRSNNRVLDVYEVLSDVKGAVIGVFAGILALGVICCIVGVKQTKDYNKESQESAGPVLTSYPTHSHPAHLA